VYGILIAVLYERFREFFRTLPRAFTEHLFAKTQPDEVVADFSTNSQRSSQQQSYSLFKNARPFVTVFIRVQIFAHPHALADTATKSSVSCISTAVSFIGRFELC
jgi:hypothetical protein